MSLVWWLPGCWGRLGRCRPAHTAPRAVLLPERKRGSAADLRDCLRVARSLPQKEAGSSARNAPRRGTKTSSPSHDINDMHNMHDMHAGKRMRRRSMPALLGWRTCIDRRILSRRATDRLSCAWLALTCRLRLPSSGSLRPIRDTAGLSLPQVMGTLPVKLISLHAETTYLGTHSY